MMRRLSFAVPALVIVGLASTALAMQPVACTKCGHWEDTVTWYLCPNCNDWFGVEPCQSEDSQLPPAQWDCPDCAYEDVVPQFALCYYVDCTGGPFWP